MTFEIPAADGENLTGAVALVVLIDRKAGAVATIIMKEALASSLDNRVCHGAGILRALPFPG